VFNVDLHHGVSASLPGAVGGPFYVGRPNPGNACAGGRLIGLSAQFVGSGKRLVLDAKTASILNMDKTP
jgi:hypothetical protein